MTCLCNAFQYSNTSLKHLLIPILVTVRMNTLEILCERGKKGNEDEEIVWSSLKTMLFLTISEKGDRGKRWSIMSSNITNATGPWLLVQLFAKYAANFPGRAREAQGLARSTAFAQDVQVRMWSVVLGAALAQAQNNQQIQQHFKLLLRDRTVSVRAWCVKLIPSLPTSTQTLFRDKLRTMCLTDPAP